MHNVDVNTHLMPGRDNASDRDLGKLWERRFCALAARYHKSFTPQQIGREASATWYTPTANGIHPTLLPDVTVWTAPGEHHEIKHKNAKDGSYGLERYRLEALLAFRRETQQPVLYTIHDWELAGASQSRAPQPNDIAHWLTVDVCELADYIRVAELSTVPFPTWVNGCKASRPGYFWPVTLWTPLLFWWDPQF